MAKLTNLLLTILLPAILLLILSAVLWTGEAKAETPARPLTAPGDCTVTTTVDSGGGSLRNCILGLQPGATITFSTSTFPPGSPATISLSSALPTIITDNVTIDGSSAGVILDGNGLSFAHGLVIDGASGVTIKGLQILNFPDDGIRLQNGATSNTIGGVNGTPGGACSGACNLISGNGDSPGDSGVKISDSGTMSNTVSGNYIGTDINGTSAISNHTGVILWFGANHNTVGGNTAGERNLISGNGTGGLGLQNSGTSSNTVVGNYIGTNNTGMTALGNAWSGIDIFNGAQFNVITGNLISGNGSAGIDVRDSGTMNNWIRANYIGTNVDGTSIIGNGWVGVSLKWGVSQNTVGGINSTPDTGCSGECNLISGNGGDGVALRDSGTMSNTISGNYVGVDVSGTVGLGNGSEDDGVGIRYGPNYNTVGGTTPGERNILSGNGDNGLKFDEANNNVAIGNYIGTNAAGTVAIPNAEDGVALQNGANNNRIGGSTAGERNLISGNSSNGIRVEGVGVLSDAPLLDDVSLTFDGGPNQLSNGDFSSNLNHWGTDDGNPLASRSLNTTDFNSAPASYQFNRNGGVGGLSTYYDTVAQSIVITDADDYGSSIWLATTPGANVTLTFWYKGSLAWVELRGHDGVDNDDFAGVDLDYASTWTQAVLTGTVPAGVDRVAVLYEVNSGPQTAENIVSGNYIGTGVSGAADVGNGGSGVNIYNAASNNTIGGSTAGERNLISGNDGQGLQLIGLGTISNTVSGNYIGTDVNGTADLGNSTDGINIFDGANNNTVGGNSPGKQNIISGNGRDGVLIENADYNTISGNYIGTNSTGTGALANNNSGVLLLSGAQHNIVGGSNPMPFDVCSPPCNLISGNNDTGVTLALTDTDNNTISGNYIGTNKTGTTALPNDEAGVFIFLGPRNNTIGGDTAGERNLISGNNDFGVRIEHPDTMSNTIEGNYIGVMAGGTGDLGNTGAGVGFNFNTTANEVSENIIAYTKHDPEGEGCGVYGPTVGGNPLRRNSIYNNDGKGICSGGSPNRPVLTEVYTDTYEVIGTALANSTIEIFSDDDDEGRYYEGTTTADAFGKFSFDGITPFLGDKVTATAIKASGSTSEFALSLSGTGRFEGTGQALGDENSNACDLGDIDVDGDLDAICANSSPNAIYLNNGRGIFEEDSTQTLGNDSSQAIALGDVDADGLLDVVIGNASGAANQVWLNGGSGQFGNSEDDRQSLEDTDTQAIALEDLDGLDGLDLVVGNSDGQTEIWLNNGSGVFQTPVTLPSLFTDTHGLAVGLLNDDDHPDIFVANGTDQPNQVWLNNGNGTFSGGENLGAFDSQAVALGDLDDDDDLDAFVANGSGQFDVVWLNQGNGQFISRTVGISNSNGVAIGRFNDDKYPDVIVASDSDQPNYVLLNNGDATFDINPIPCNDSADSQDIAIGDLDNDGDLDVFVANGDDDDEDEPDDDDRPNQVLKNLNNLRNRVGPNGGTLDFGQGMPLTLQVPANALSEFTNFDYVPEETPGSAPANMSFAGRAFSISPASGSGGFSRAVTTTVYFDPEAFEGSRPLLHYWETEGDNANSWVDVAETCIDLLGSPSSYSYGDDWLKVGLCHLTEFGIFGTPGSDVYLPIIVKNN